MIAIAHNLWFYLHKKMHCESKVKTSHLMAFESSQPLPKRKLGENRDPFVQLQVATRTLPKQSLSVPWVDFPVREALALWDVLKSLERSDSLPFVF